MVNLTITPFRLRQARNPNLLKIEDYHYLGLYSRPPEEVKRVFSRDIEEDKAIREEWKLKNPLALNILEAASQLTFQIARDLSTQHRRVPLSKSYPLLRYRKSIEPEIASYRFYSLTAHTGATYSIGLTSLDAHFLSPKAEILSEEDSILAEASHSYLMKTPETFPVINLASILIHEDSHRRDASFFAPCISNYENEQFFSEILLNSSGFSQTHAKNAFQIPLESWKAILYSLQNIQTSYLSPIQKRLMEWIYPDLELEGQLTNNDTQRQLFRKAYSNLSSRLLGFQKNNNVYDSPMIYESEITRGFPLNEALTEWDSYRSIGGWCKWKNLSPPPPFLYTGLTSKLVGRASKIDTKDFIGKSIAFKQRGDFEGYYNYIQQLGIQCTREDILELTENFIGS